MCRQLLLSIIMSNIDWSIVVEIISIISSSILSIVAIVISIKTLKQNNKMIEDSSRPYINISKHVVAISTPKEYLILKNYGTSSAEILDIKCSVPIEDLVEDTPLKRNPFSYLIGTSIAPNQCFSPIISTLNIKEEIITFTIKYKTDNKTYTTTSHIRTQQDHGMVYTKISTKDKELEIISNTLQEMIRQNF